LTYAWTNGTTSLGSSATLTLTSSTASPSDTIKCTVTAKDVDSGTDSGTDSVTVSNTDPAFTSVTITPSSGVTNTSSLACSASASDADGGTPTLTYAWTNGTASLGSSSSLTLTTSTASPSDTITCTATAKDTDGGSATKASTVSVDNRAPSISKVSLAPSKVYTDDTITSSVTASDADGDTVSLSYTWVVDSVVSAVTNSYISGVNYFDKGESVYVIVTPNDGTVDGTAVASAAITISNTAPTAPVIAIDPTSPIVGVDDLICLIDTASTDDDGDTITTSFAWTVDGSTWTGTTSKTYTSGDTISGADTLTGEIWKCTAMPNDGTTNGATDSDSVTINSNSISLSTSDYSFIGETTPDYAGRTVENAGDVDGDGLDDIIVGSIGDSTNGTAAGAAYIILRSSLGKSTTIDLSLADYKLLGEAAGDRAGISVASAGDVDRDGLGDIIVGAYGDDTGGSGAGAAYIILGSSLGSTSTIDLSLADYKLVGEAKYDSAGFKLAGAGDVDGDGYDDVLVGAHGEDSAGSTAGAVYLIFGASLGTTSTIDLSTADYKFTGEAKTDYLGYEAVSAGDVDGDGYNDIVLGAPYEDTGGSSAGAVYIVLGKELVGAFPAASPFPMSSADYKLIGEDANDKSGLSAVVAGDLDGDGYDDILVGADGDDDGGSGAGAVYVILGSSLGKTASIDLSLADYKLIGENASDAAGYRVAAAGDVDGDNLNDILLSAPGSDTGGTNSGTAYILLASSLSTSPTIDLGAADYKLVAENAGDAVGWGLATAGDLDCDGRDEVLIGAWQNDDGGSQAGKVYLWSSTGQLSKNLTSSVDACLSWGSKINAEDSDYIIIGENEGDAWSTSYSVSSAGDMDGDGRDDLLIGAGSEDTAAAGAGAAYIILASSLGNSKVIDLADADYKLLGYDWSDSTGEAVAGVGDLDGDGLDDIIIGAPHAISNYRGYTYILLGSSLGTKQTLDLYTDCDYYLYGDTSYDDSGASVSAAGDVNGDGTDDFLVAAMGHDDGGSMASATYLFFGSNLSSVATSYGAIALVNDYDYKFIGEDANDYSGSSVASAGDVDGDGDSDIIIGAIYEDAGGSASGSAYIFLAASLGTTADIDLSAADYKLVGEYPGDYAGTSVASAGDVDGDGLDDVLVGSKNNDDNGSTSGKAYLILGASLATSSGTVDLSLADYSFVGESQGDNAGQSVSTAGDVDSDGFSDILIGAPSHDGGGKNAGSAYLFLSASLGSTTTLNLSEADYKFIGTSANDRLGEEVALAGDVNGDGVGDILVGSGAPDGDRGHTYVFLP
jgi:hypothetical protein